jgi:protein CpxP
MTHTRDRITNAVTAGAPSVFIVTAVAALLFAVSLRPSDAQDVRAGPLVAQAAPAPAPSAANTAGQAARPSGAPAAQTAHGPAERVEARISELHQKLHISPAQESQFKAFADVMRSNAQTMQGLFQQRAQSTDMSAVARLRWYAQLTTAHGEAVTKLVPVFEALYQSMADAQKKDADAVFEELRQRRAARRAG